MSKNLSTVDPALARLGIPVPASRLALEALKVAGAAEPAYLLNHSTRSFVWAAALAAVDGRRFDPEILYVAAVLHDLGLAAAYDHGGCYELDGAKAAEDLARAAGWPADRCRAMAEVVALHMAATLPPDASAETALLWDSTGVDVTGWRYEDVPAPIAAKTLAIYPRLGFKSAFAHLFAEQAERKPGCRGAEMVRERMLERIASAPFES